MRFVDTNGRSQPFPMPDSKPPGEVLENVLSALMLRQAETKVIE